ncbi:MAG: DUF4190 domain-containing protein [Bacteroidota bacterium]
MKKNLSILLVGLLCLIGTPKTFAVVSLQKAASATQQDVQPIVSAEETPQVKPKKKSWKERKAERIAQKIEKGALAPRGLAIAGFVTGLVGMLLPGFLVAVVGIVLSGIAITRYRYAGHKKGRGLAIAGLILGIIGAITAFAPLGMLLLL